MPVCADSDTKAWGHQPTKPTKATSGGSGLCPEGPKGSEPTTLGPVGTAGAVALRPTGRPARLGPRGGPRGSLSLHLIIGSGRIVLGWSWSTVEEGEGRKYQALEHLAAKLCEILGRLLSAQVRVGIENLVDESLTISAKQRITMNRSFSPSIAIDVSS